MVVSKRKYKGRAKPNALALFGVERGKMESKDVREDMAIQLSLSEDPKFQALARMARDPIHTRTAFTTLMEKLAITYHQLSQEYKGLQRDKGYIQAAKHLPELMEQTAIDAKSKWEECWTCKGTGKVERILNKGKEDEKRETVDCANCRASGKVYVLGDPDRLKLIFDTFGLTGKGGGLNVNLDLRKVDAPEDLADLHASLGPLIEGDSK